MKKIYILAFSAMFSTTALVAQSNKQLKMSNAAKNIAVKNDKKYLTGFEGIDESKPGVPSSAFARGVAKSLGSTNYDLQTNGSMKPRIVNLGAGKISGSFTFGTGDIAAGVPDRGTGYNTNASGAFLPMPTKRVESVRTGFTNLCVDTDGTEYAFAHGSATAGFKLIMSKKAKGATTWKQSDIPSSIPNGELWPNVAIGGANGKTIHAVATTDQPYQGMLRAMVYFRSKDGGATWDKKDVILPGVDSLGYKEGMDGDSYVVTAKGNTIAIAFFGGWEDTNVWISQDNGDTWAKKTVYKFPLTNYVPDSGYDETLLPPDPNRPNAKAIFSSDQSGSVFIDKDGKVHVVFGRMYVSDADVATAGTNFFPGTSSFVHWDETYKKDSLQYLEAFPDKNQNDSIDIGQGYGTYYTSLTSYPSTAVGPDGTIYLVYSAIDELSLNGDGNNYRHIYIVYSKDNGKTWSKKPFDIISNAKYLSPKDFDAEYAECVFPSVASLIDNGKLHIVYQIDDSQGLHVRHPTDETIDYTDNFINYVDVDIADLLVATEEVVAPATFNFAIAPNPAHDEIRLSYDLKNPSDVKITLTDLTGRVVTSANVGRQNTGVTAYNMNVNAAPGLYFVQLNINGQIATQKVVIK